MATQTVSHRSRNHNDPQARRAEALRVIQESLEARPIMASTPIVETGDHCDPDFHLTRILWGAKRTAGGYLA